MKKMKPHEPQMCSWCKEKANWRTTRTDKGKYACDEHMKDLRKYEQDNKRKVVYDDGYMSEGEWWAYGRIGY